MWGGPAVVFCVGGGSVRDARLTGLWGNVVGRRSQQVGGSLPAESRQRGAVGMYVVAWKVYVHAMCTLRARSLHGNTTEENPRNRI